MKSGGEDPQSFVETLDEAAFRLVRAGFPDAYSWTPRTIMHRAAMLSRLRAEDLLEDINVQTTAARGDQKAVNALAESASKAARRISHDPPEQIKRPAKRSESISTEMALKAAGII